MAAPIAPTKVLSLQCHDVTSWITKTEKVERKFNEPKRVKLSKTVRVPKKTYTKVKAIRYREEMVE